MRTVLESQSVDLGLYGKKKKNPYFFVALFSLYLLQVFIDIVCQIRTRTHTQSRKVKFC